MAFQWPPLKEAVVAKPRDPGEARREIERLKLVITKKNREKNEPKWTGQHEEGTMPCDGCTRVFPVRELLSAAGGALRFCVNCVG